MNIDINDLEKYVNLLSQDKNENCCLICNLGNEINCIKLRCNHYFHKKCLHSIRCPYCDETIITPPKPKPKTKSNNVSNTFGSTYKCLNIIKSGKRKGEVCGRFCCKYHEKEKWCPSINI
ncbi:hypothetical protein crov207 [Cafeteria roenbergensis virus]|uniref:RING-type domain-containing protein n=1 Tax=Cafeteria roenbergensis virus (strain BV-PW1) TaxID=693272 RepID=E3T4X7_CROVB|nr:hypothetical protein crov207 [Cafeteria roenbergensis virus BV-PW1]ADO67240.1 hypothetical protein crov207 [Cafeteria roenbergensis virus BV-PW1]